MLGASPSQIVWTGALVAAWIFYGGQPVCAQAEVTYEVIDIGTLNGRASAALSINDAGQIVGEADES